jgi:parallel beta-helix repeat protein
MRSIWLALLLAVILQGCQGAGSPNTEVQAQNPLQTAQASVPRPTAESAGRSRMTYYVDTSGADTNDGSATTPWRTLQHAVDSVAPGDTILVRSGIYEGMRIERSGRADAWITLKAAPEAVVLVNAPGPNNRHGSNIEVETWEGDGIVAYWIIERLEVADAPNWGIDLRGSAAGHSHHFVIRGNRVHDNGVKSGKSGIFTAFVDDLIIENNDSYDNGEHGIYLSNSGDRFLVRGNRLRHNTFCGLHMNGDASQGGDGIISMGTIENNVIYENGYGGCSAINMDGVRNAIVGNNLIYMNHAGGISIFQEDGATCSQDNLILNNTVIMADDGRWAVNISGDGCINNQLFNNVLYSHHEWRGSISIPSAHIPGFESNNNVLMDRLSIDDGESVTGLAEWQALGYDDSSLVASPEELFIDPEGNDYRLRAGSPAIDAGLALSEVDDDIAGSPRPRGGSFDIGAFESSMTRVPTQTPTARP